MLRDLYSTDVLRVVVDSEDAVARVNRFGPDQANLIVEHHEDASEILEHYKVNAAIRDALKPGWTALRWLRDHRAHRSPHGGRCEPGFFTRSANARETVLWTNWKPLPRLPVS